MHNLDSFLTPGQGDCYLIAQKQQKDALIEPYRYACNGVDTLLTSVAAVVIDDNQLKAVIASDISFVSLQQTVEAIKPWKGTGYAMLLSNKGLVVSSPEKEQAGKPYKGETDKFTRQIAGHFDNVLGEDVPETWRPVQVGNSDMPWYLGIVTPVKDVMAAANRQLMRALIMMVLSIVIVCTVLGLIFSRKIARPIGGEPAQAAEIALGVAKGNLTAEIPVGANDRQSIFFAMQAMQQQLRTMVGEIASGNLDLASRTEQQAAALEETALAQRSANTVKDISALISESTHRVDQGVTLMQDAGKTMQEMTSAVNSVKTIIGEIVHASDEQSQGNGQVTVAVNQMDGATQQNSALAQQMSAAAAALEDQAQQLAQTVQRFRLDAA